MSSPLERAVDTAQVAVEGLGGLVSLATDERLRESDFSTYLQGAPMHRLAWHRPLYLLGKRRWGLLPRDESVRELGVRVLAVMSDVADTGDDPCLLVGHAAPLQAAWVLIDGRRPIARELGRKEINKAGTLVVEVDGGVCTPLDYVTPPPIEWFTSPELKPGNLGDGTPEVEALPSG